MTILLQAAPEAPAAPGVMGGGASFWVMMLAVFAVMYFLMIRPQQKKQKEVAKFQNSLERGQKVVTAGGIFGTIKEVKEHYVLVEIDNNVSIRIAKNMVMKDASDLAQQGK